MVSIKRLLDALAAAVTLLAAIPLFPFLDTAPRIVLPLALVAGVWGDRRGRPLLKPALATILSVAFFFLYALQVSRANLVTPLVNLLALLLAVRLVTAKEGRNYLQIFVLALFALAASSLLSLSATFLIYLVLLVVLVTIGLVLLSFFATDQALALPRREFRTVLGVAAVLPAASLLLMLAFFVILPRTQRPLWNFLNPIPQATAGLADQVRPGAFAAIADNSQVAFRAEAPSLPREKLYWRGLVLNTLEGEDWVRSPPPAREQERAEGGKMIAQTLYPEPSQSKVLFALDPPVRFEGIRGVRRTADSVFTARHGLERRVRYQALSVVDGVLTATAPVDRAFYLQVPAHIDPRLTALAARIRTQAKSAAERVALLEDFFRSQKLAYATTDLAGGADPLADFLFEKKRGYCEFFASSFGLLLRLSGVPTRLVGGYLGGEYNALGGYYLVTQESAHVWVEALVDGRHWRRIDPSTLAVRTARTGGLSRWRLLADTASYFWNQAVINYDLGSQLALLRKAGGRLRNLGTTGPGDRWWKWALGILILAGMGWTLRRRRPRLPSREERLLHAFLRQVRRRYSLPEDAGREGLMTLAKRLDDPRCREFATVYGGAVYRDRRLSAEEAGRLKELVRELRRDAKSEDRG